MSTDVVDEDHFDYKHYGTFTVTVKFGNCVDDESMTFDVDVDQV